MKSGRPSGVIFGLMPPLVTISTLSRGIEVKALPIIVSFSPLNNQNVSNSDAKNESEQLYKLDFFQATQHLFRRK